MKKFDADRSGKTGTREWAERSFNICTGCSHDCRYCYAAANAERFKVRDRDDWSREVLSPKSEITSFPKYQGVVMFPTSHDITAGTVAAYIRVARIILEKGNRMLLVSKPGWDVLAVLDALGPWREQVLLRFSIGCLDPELMKWWEPGAPAVDIRLGVLRSAYLAGWQTSVSIEPMLSGVKETVQLVESVSDYVSDSIWIGVMNNIRGRVVGDSGDVRAAIARINALQNPRAIGYLVSMLWDHPQVRWKDSILRMVWGGGP